MERVIKSKEGEVKSREGDLSDRAMIKIFLMKEFIKSWSQINLLYHSPWENVREIYNLLLLEAFKEGISYFPQMLRKKAL